MNEKLKSLLKGVDTTNDAFVLENDPLQTTEKDKEDPQDKIKTEKITPISSGSYI